MAERNEQILTPSQLNALARDLLEGSFPLVWVEAELSSVTRPSSGHLYFTLKDARAQIRCAMFKPKSTWLKFQPREGLRVLARGRLTLYEARGDYQLVLDHMEEAGEGALRRAFDALRARLAAEGLFDAERKQLLPAHVQRLAVITSPSGAAVRDVLSVLARRFPLLEVDLLPSLVQGDSAAAQITSLLQRADASGRYDVILITRGGGSLEDLWAFNDERLARAIAAAQTPVVSAVGHETDFSLSDFVADVRAPTPSVAAELLVPDQRELVPRVRRAQARMTQLQQHALGNAMQRADRLALRLRAHSPQARLQLLHRRQEEAGRQLGARMTQVLERLQARVQRGHAQVQSHNPQRHLAGLQQRLRALHPQAAMQRRLQHDQLQLRSIARSLEAVNPLATVARGYAIVTRPADGSVVRSAAEVAAGERLRAQLADGSIEVRVEPGER
ncbi:exodeoxyribonuclease VII large subunit [Xanthomonas oryzae pv. oryzae]|uniref:Exodeoxyribonuclease 7 large subunit n=1 Tax=Xanthomonas oryzae pv. oryzae (strain PXO99A) TaxID=360094 RepID=EX7L_XANOP|nr:exodeoxyribonuclease VII large subunit [Xanthomonas oryzae]B2SHP3.1 RecName: Full=Exodeoxyribonuclease 7 large subunit; AltName: Full=Exodeoxyribonuclease VII large subunit; Short=Exonuclease VII large subunit [Xanthomonas oryzae pv. oryzae PXO99A]ACD58553.1 exodeoxyribonuclease VII, large subunit [Xanthomonas oryzae pv. oryzae PXO99A]AXM39764.1 exodeoxyribonuclease VII large subunit [Xanthomonas oryzae pv. oryzae]OLH16948.1 exodeoxyribonuclease [Xanthomonas oryzae pv. oryzae]OLH69845.1 exo